MWSHPKTRPAMCVQRFDDSRNSAIHTTYRISLRSSSLREPRYPLLRVVSVRSQGCPRTKLLQGGGFHGLSAPLGGGRGGMSPPAPTGRFRIRRAEARKFSGIGLIGFNDPSAGSPTETLLRLLLPLNGRVQRNSRNDGQETGPKFQS